MTVAVCLKCGSIKHGAFNDCQACGVRPETETDLAYSLALTDHYFARDALDQISVAMLGGKPRPSLPADQEQVLRVAVRDHSSGSKTLVLKVPRRELEGNREDRDMIAQLIKPVTVADNLTSTLSDMLPSLAGKMDRTSEEMVGNHALDLIAMSLAKSMEGGRSRVSGAKALVLLNIRSVVEARLGDPALDAQAPHSRKALPQSAPPAASLPNMWDRRVAMRTKRSPD